MNRVHRRALAARLAGALLAASVATSCGAHGVGADPAAFASRVVRFEPGEGATWGRSRLPDVVLGPPRGGGEFMGGTDVLSLGAGGSVCLELEGEAYDGPGVDLLVFENAFTIAGTDRVFIELGEVSVSDDGVRFVTFACASRQAPYAGCAGRSPVYSTPENGLDPADPRVAGGDGFDLADVGLSRARFVCVRDLETQALAPPTTGFDLDAVVAVHARPR